MKNQQLIDHLFRHQYGKMVSILTKVFGFQHLETIEDAVQDTFIQAMRTWSKGMPDNPEAWLTTAAKNRVIDIFRSINAQKARSTLISNPLYDFPLEDLFLETEIEDSQLRMIFTACHPALDAKLQIAFALKTISGFSIKEIASAMLKRQQATAIVAARHKIVQGAVEMVEMALEELNKKEIVELDEERKAAMVSNLLVILCGDKEASPVVNTGTLSH